MVKVLLTCGFAGSGKSTFTGNYCKFLTQEQNARVYTVNLDPAVKYLQYVPDLDIRDNVNYKSVMIDNGLGPNGAITTSLNLFCTRIDQICEILIQKKDSYDFILIDTPGQIEVFVWSIAGEIIMRSLNSCFDNVHIAFLLNDYSDYCDPKSLEASTVLYACSIYYKLHTPLFMLINHHENKRNDKWISSEGRYHDELVDNIHECLDEIYNKFKKIDICATTGTGFTNIFVIDKIAHHI